LRHDLAGVGRRCKPNQEIHFAGFDEDAGVFRIVNIWETREQGQAYRDEHVMPRFAS
jgi:hypothetical protein